MIKKISLFFIILFMIFGFSTTAFSISSDTFNLPQIYNPQPFDDPNNNFDGDINTFSEFTITTGDDAQNYNGPGLMFDEQQVDSIYINAFAGSTATGVDRFIYLETFNGSDWTNITGSPLIDNIENGTWITTVNVNDTIQGLRFRFFHDFVVSSTFTYRGYLINFTPSTKFYFNTTAPLVTLIPTNNTRTDLFSYFYLGNQSSNPSKFDGTINGKTFNDGTLTNFADTTRVSSLNSTFGKAINFDGIDDYIDIGNGQESNFVNENFTLSLWLKPDSIQSFAISRLVSGATTNKYWAIGATTGGYELLLSDGNSSNGFFNSGNVPISTSNWNYLTFVYDDSNKRVLSYLNGSLLFNESSSESGDFGNADNTIIGSRGLFTNFYDGLIDEIRIYKKALSINDIQNDMISSNPTSDFITGSYSFNEDIGTTTYDTNHIIQGQTIPNQGTKGMVFDGVNDYVEVNHNTSLNINSNGFTWSTWLKSSDVSSVYSLMRKSTTEYVMATVGSKVFCQVSTGSINVGSSLTNDQLHLLTCVWNGSHLISYLDGVEQGSTSLASPATDVNNLFIGSNAGVSQFTNGIQDDVRIYNTTLSVSDISNIFNGTYYNRSNLVAHYTFEEMQNSLIHDRNNQLNVNGLNQNLSFTSLSETLYTNWLFDGQTNNTQFFNLEVDLINPTINNSIPANITSYSFDGSSFSCSDINLETCNISIDGFNKASGENFNLTTNGNLSYNITAIDLAGNQISESGVVFNNPFFQVNFINNSNVTITDFKVNGTTYNDSFFGQIYDFGLGNHTFLWQKDGYEEFNFTLEFNETSVINQTINVNPATITILIKNVDTGNLTDPNNFTILLNVVETGESFEFTITNDNTLEISNDFANQTELALSVIQNETIISSVSLVNARQDVNISLYVTDRTTVNRIFEVLNPSLSVVTDSYVFLYIFIPGEGFVLQSQKRTNGVGQVTFPIIENVKTYTLCNTLNGIEKCLQQVIFEDPLTDPFQIIHAPDLTSNSKEVLDFISYSFIENKSNSSTQMTFIFDDALRLTTQFCMNVSRFTNGSNQEDLGAFCVDSYAGNVVQTFSLTQDQRIDFTFQYTYENVTTVLNKFSSYFQDQVYSELKQKSVFDFLFIFIYFGVLSLLLRFGNFDWYNVGLLGTLLVIFIIQSVISENWVNLGVWGFMAIKTITLYTVRQEG